MPPAVRLSLTSELDAFVLPSSSLGALRKEGQTQVSQTVGVRCVESLDPWQAKATPGGTNSASVPETGIHGKDVEARGLEGCKDLTEE